MTFSKFDAKLLLLFFICLVSTGVSAQHSKQKSVSLKSFAKDTLKVNQLLTNGYQQLQQYLDNGTGMDSANLFSKHAGALSSDIGYANGVDMAALLQARIYLVKGDVKTTKNRLKSLAKQSQVGLWISLARQAVKIRRTKENADSALVYLNRADAIAKVLGSAQLRLVVKSALAQIQVNTGDVDKGIETYNQVMAVYTAKANERMIGRTLVQMADNIPHLPKYYDDVISCTDRAIKIYTKLNRDTVGMMMMIKGSLYDIQLKRSLAEKETLQAIEIFKATKSPLIVLAYSNMSGISRDLGNNPKALEYLIESINAAIRTKQTNYLGVTYQRLGVLYLAQNQLDKSIEAYQLAFDLIKKKTSFAPGEILILTRSIADVMGRKGKLVEALEFIDEMERKYPPQPGPEQSVLPVVRGSLYARLGKFDIAEKYYLEALKISEKLGPSFKNNAMILIGGFYIKTKQWEKAKSYYELLNSLPNKVLPAPEQRNVQLNLFRIDSAAGNMIGAMDHYQQYRIIADTIYNAINYRKYLELQINYETDKKDKDILLKQKNIEILKKQDLLHKTMLDQASLQMRLDQQKREQEIKVVALENERKNRDFIVFRLRAKEKDDNIKRLKMEAKLQQNFLTQARINKNLTYGSILLLALVVALLFSRYRIKQRANKLLNAQKEEISQQNSSLKELVEKKDSLIIEKEWLVKEIHHRVKNNLQIVISLLRTQTDYLDNDVALLAIKQSQHRMQAMSLIHQRLYQSESMSCINIDEYVKEMIAYLSDSMDREHKIVFVVDIVSISLNIGQAIPLGLILNESITNAIKYAFKSIAAPKIEISLSAIVKDELCLIIADNGKGLDEGFNPKATKSLGMSLILGLSKQLGGNCSMVNDGGLRITINFKGNLTSGETSYLSVMAS